MVIRRFSYKITKLLCILRARTKGTLLSHETSLTSMDCVHISDLKLLLATDDNQQNDVSSKIDFQLWKNGHS